MVNELTEEISLRIDVWFSTRDQEDDAQYEQEIYRDAKAIIEVVQVGVSVYY